MSNRKSNQPIWSRLRKNDTVMVIGGDDRGKTGKVLRVLPAQGRAIVEKVNFIKRHTRPNPSRNQKGGIVEREAPIHLSNLMLVCPDCSEPTRIGHRQVAPGERVRVCRRCGSSLDR
jgi:large subunit ribosomal protein L24